MDQQTYLKKFSRAARWYLPRREASEVTADYKTMLSERTESGGDLVAELGKPSRAAWLLREKRAYAKWLAAFVLMALCLLAPEVWLLTARFPRPVFCMAVPLVIGLVVVILWFRRDFGVKGDIPCGLRPAVFVLIVILAAALLILWCLAQNPLVLPPNHIGPIARQVLLLAGIVTGILALWGLIQGRMTDPRWAVLYGLGLVILMLCALVMADLTSMDADPLPILSRFLGRG
jgi:hypothetical protein